jgi:hypothetical protein
MPKSTLLAVNLLAILLSTVMLSACKPAKQSEFLMVQLCLGNEDNLAEFMNMMRSVAQSEHMNYVDGSAETKRNLETIGARKPGQADPFINIGIEDKHRSVLMMGGNLGLPGYQVALGFGEGTEPSEAHALADEIVRILNTRWQVLTVPAGKGALPLKACGNNPSAS